MLSLKTLKPTHDLVLMAHALSWWHMAQALSWCHMSCPDGTCLASWHMLDLMAHALASWHMPWPHGTCLAWWAHAWPHGHMLGLMMGTCLGLMGTCLAWWHMPGLMAHALAWWHMCGLLNTCLAWWYMAYGWPDGTFLHLMLHACEPHPQEVEAEGQIARHLVSKNKNNEKKSLCDWNSYEIKSFCTTNNLRSL